MTPYVAFLRAINVAGHARVKMEDVRQAFSEAGCRDVRSYIQSGNVLCTAPDEETERQELFDDVLSRVGELIGEEPTILFHPLEDIARLVERNPFAQVEAGAQGDESPPKLYVVFLAEEPARAPQLPLRSEKERLEVIGVEDRQVYVVSRVKDNGFYGFPNAFVEKELGVQATSRNWNTVRKVAGLLK